MMNDQKDIQEVAGSSAPSVSGAEHIDNSHEISEEQIKRAKQIKIRDIIEHMSGPVISVILHVVLFAVLGTVIIFQPPQERKDIEVNVEELEIKELEKIPEPPKPPDEINIELDIELETPEVKQMVSEVSVEDMKVEDVDVNVSVPDLLAVKPSDSALKLPGVYSMRTGVGRQTALKMYGGSKHTEKAVMSALRWLAKNQNDDGSWGINPSTRPAFTALVMLAFLGHGETPQSAEFGSVVVKAFRRLVTYVEDMKRAKQKYVKGPTYTHAIIAYAISEAYGITNLPRMKKAMDATMGIVIDKINPRGSYRFGYGTALVLPWLHRDPTTGRYPKKHKYTEPYSDLSFAGWNYQALKSAFSAGSEAPGLGDAIDKAIAGLKYHYKKGQIGKGDFGLNCLGTLCLGLLGEGNSKAAKAGLKLIKSKIDLVTKCYWDYDEDVHKRYKKAFAWAMYTWYYQTQVIFQITKGKGKFWQFWNNAFSKAFIREQEKDGHWSSPAEKYGGDILNPVKDNAEFTGVKQFKKPLDLYIYCTAFGCLTMEVYYRYLPTYKLKRKASGKSENIFTESNEDLGLEIN